MAKIVIEIFSAEWCPHCHPAVEMVSEVIEGREEIELIVWDVDSPEGRKKAEEFMITAIPTIIINGEIAFIGRPTKEQFLEKLKEFE